jgi:hypothetical protein
VLPYTSSESLGLHRTRLRSNRGNGYLKPGEINGPDGLGQGIFPNFDCKNTDYTPLTMEGDPETTDEEEFDDSDQPPVHAGFAPCLITKDSPGRFGGDRVPQVRQDP